MISRVHGRLVSVSEQKAIVDNQGISYELMLPSALAEKLLSDGHKEQEVTFETIYYIEAGDRKATHFPRLVGFFNPVDREFFSLLTQVSGMGVKKALKSLVLPIREIALAIEEKDAATLSRLPGVGARLAEKIIAELNGKTTRFALAKSQEPLASRQPQKQPVADEAIAVLTQLQYSRREAEEMISAALKQQPQIETVEDLITEIFRNEQQAKVVS